MKIKMSIALVVMVFFAGFLIQTEDPNITEAEIKEHITYLASDELKGRFTGTLEERIAGEYIKNEFEKAGLLPAFNGSYFQEFPFIEGISLGENNNASMLINKQVIELEFNKDFMTAPFSRHGSADAEVVFAGYGISAPKLEYDDYEDIDVKNKVVLVFRFSPEYANPHSQFDAYSAFRSKATAAKERGALGIIFVNGFFPETHEDNFMEFNYDRAPGIDNFCAIQISRKIAEQIFSSQNIDMKELQKRISESKKPESMLLSNVKVNLSVEVNETEKIGRNVGAYLKGTDETLSTEIIVIGAHYDHLGMGQHGSLYRGEEPMIHNGADDNASGTTGVLEIAEKLSLGEIEPKRSFYFFAFSGEELGLLGSNYLVNNFPEPIENVTAMINMDMIGRMDDGTSLSIFGIGTSSKWEEIIETKNNNRFNLSLNEDGYGPSDHSSFYGKEIPVLFFFTGTHTDYHRPSDDADKINITGQKHILDFIYDITREIDNLETKPDYINVPRKQESNMGGWKVYVGTIPDYAYSGEGFRLTGVSPGSPAEKAGIKGGDIMIKFGDRSINNIYDYVYALQEYVPGDVVEIELKRGEEAIYLKLELGAK
ncbi:MAG: M28 family peptidase [Melioribacteraceae bacterium]|nr:M28 family peptidase [Melioribacteraceae bacterium]